jgi:hypothetical protein
MSEVLRPDENFRKRTRKKKSVGSAVSTDAAADVPAEACSPDAIVDRIVSTAKPWLS